MSEGSVLEFEIFKGQSLLKKLYMNWLYYIKNLLIGISPSVFLDCETEQEKLQW